MELSAFLHLFSSFWVENGLKNADDPLFRTLPVKPIAGEADS